LLRGKALKLSKLIGMRRARASRKPSAILTRCSSKRAGQRSLVGAALAIARRPDEGLAGLREGVAAREAANLSDGSARQTLLYGREARARPLSATSKARPRLASSPEQAT
jgi:hypothetical protein